MKALAAIVMVVVLTGPLGADDLAQLKFLIGRWQAIDTAAGESGSFTFELAVQDHVMLRRNEAIYEATIIACRIRSARTALSPVPSKSPRPEAATRSTRTCRGALADDSRGRPRTPDERSVERYTARMIIDPEEHEVDALLARLPAVDRCVVVEVGCGDGRLTRRYSRHVGTVLAVDPDQAALAAIRQDGIPGNVEVREMPIDRLALPDESVDAVLFSWAL
ncbi:MAG: hypothetical protein DMG04_09565 [Acidobacteria bacterium]|nr:MAG: hypothetical protein DMG04_09565 [Acidobacteriota bacterium]